MNMTVILFSALLSQAPSPEPAPEPLDYPALMALVREKNPNIEQAKARLAAAEGQLSKVWAAWHPSLTAQGQGKYVTPETVFELAPFAGMIVGVVGGDPANLPEIPDSVIQPHWSASGALVLRQLLFDPSAWWGASAARRGRKAQRLAVEATTDEVLFGAGQLYAGIQAVNALEAAARRAVKVAEDRIKEAQARVDAGLATPIDITRAQVALANNKSQVAQVLAQREALQADLQALVGARRRVVLADSPIPEDLGPAGAGPGDRHDVKATEAAVEAAREGARRTGRLWLPTVFAEGQLQATTIDGFSGDHYYAQALIGVRIPLYDGTNWAEDDVAEAQLSEAQASLRETRARATALEQKAIATFERSKIQLELAKTQLTLATQAVDQVNRLHDNGLATSLDLEDADARKFGAERQLVERSLDVALSRLRLHYARGGSL